MVQFEDLMKTIKENLDIFGVGRGIKSKDIILDFFKENYGIDNMPTSIIDFYSNYDGIAFSTVGNVYSIIENDSVEAYSESINEDTVKSFCESIDIDTNEYKFFFIGSDGMGGYYAIRTDKEDEKIYWIDHEFPDKFKEILTQDTFDNELIFENFTVFLDRMIDDTIVIEREDEQEF